MKKNNIIALLDMLTNSMEFYTLAEFIELAKDFETTSIHMANIWANYWELTPHQRFESSPEVLTKLINISSRGMALNE